MKKTILNIFITTISIILLSTSVFAGFRVQTLKPGEIGQAMIDCYSYPDAYLDGDIPMIKPATLVSKSLNGNYTWNTQTKTLDIYADSYCMYTRLGSFHARIKVGDNHIYYSGTTIFGTGNQTYTCRVPNKIVNGSLYVDAAALEPIARTAGSVYWSYSTNELCYVQ